MVQTAVIVAQIIYPHLYLRMYFLTLHSKIPKVFLLTYIYSPPSIKADGLNFKSETALIIHEINS